MTTYKDYEKELKKLNAKDEEKRQKAALEFQRVCEKEGVQHRLGHAFLISPGSNYS